jgi:hypothetical protein
MDSLDDLTEVNGAEAIEEEVVEKAPTTSKAKYSRKDLENKNILELRKICKNMGFPCLDKEANIKNILSGQ